MYIPTPGDVIRNPSWTIHTFKKKKENGSSYFYPTLEPQGLPYSLWGTLAMD